MWSSESFKKRRPSRDALTSRLTSVYHRAWQTQRSDESVLLRDDTSFLTYDTNLLDGHY